MDRELASRIRALALASRCLTREINNLQESSKARNPSAVSSPETERLIGLARTILDPSGLTNHAPPRSVSESLLRASEPGAPLPAPWIARPDGPIADAAPSNEHVLAFLGHGAVLPISELIGFLGTIGKTGILRVSTADQSFVLEFLQGYIVHGEASCSPPGYRLGDLLVAQGVIDRASLESAFAEGPTKRLGRTLLKKQLIEKEHLTAALRVQIQWLFNRLFREEVKSFTFWSGPPIWAEDGVHLNTTSLLLEGARLSDEVDDSSQAAQAEKSQAPAESLLEGS